MTLVLPEHGKRTQKNVSNAQLSTNTIMQNISEIMDNSLNNPPTLLPQIQVKPETWKLVQSHSQKKKTKAKKMHDPAIKSDKPPTCVQQVKIKQELPKQSFPPRHNKTKKQKAKNKQSQKNKPSDSKSKTAKESYQYAEKGRTKGKDGPGKKKRKQKKMTTKPKKTKQNSNPPTTQDKNTIQPNKRWRPRKVKKYYPIWRFLNRFNRRPRPKSRRPHHKKVVPKWASKCKNCILSSSVHDIVNSQYTKNTSRLMPQSQLRAMLSSDGRKRIPEQQWMRSMEMEAIRKYKKMKSHVQVMDYEVVRHPENPWLVGLCMWSKDRHTKEMWPLLVKCFYKYPDRTLLDASKHHSFCLKWNDVNYLLREDHTYYTQMQCILAITDKIYAELLVHTRKETTIVPVYFDADFWEETEIRLDKFFTCNVLPYLKNNGMEQGNSGIDDN